MKKNGYILTKDIHDVQSTLLGFINKQWKTTNLLKTSHGGAHYINGAKTKAKTFPKYVEANFYN